MDPVQTTQEQGKAVKLAAPEQKQQLLDLIEATKGKLSEFNSKSFSTDNQIESDNNDALKQLFTILQQAGVDLTDPKSVSDFLNKLNKQNPQLAQMFESAISELLGNETTQQPDMGMSQPSQAPDMGMQTQVPQASGSGQPMM